MNSKRTHGVSEKFAELEQMDAMVKGMQEQLDQLTSRRNDLITALGEITNTLPPSDVVTHRERLRQFEQTLGRAERRNILREYNRNIVLLALLLTAACTLTWWALRIMKGG